MKKIRFILPLAALLMLGLLAGCSQDEDGVVAAGASADDFTYLDLNETYGGLSATDEEEAFGDEALKAMMLTEDGQEIQDPLADDPEVQRLQEMGRHTDLYRDGARPKFTYLRLRWGMLRGPEDTTVVERPCELTDWTGEIHTDRGLVVVKRTIRFEAGDHVIFPRLNPQTVAFVSRTTCGFDGLVLQIIERPDTSATGEVADLEPNKLTINAGPFRGEYLVSELAGMNEVFDVDDSGNRFQIEGFTLTDIEVCPKGFLSGRYRRVPPQFGEDRPDTAGGEDRGELYGHFAGTWRDLNGRIQGFLRGGYGINAEGERVFMGKYIDRRGRFQGLLRGTWEPGDQEGNLASFKGQWGNRREGVIGILGGEAHPVEGYPGGFFTGRWTVSCDDEAEDGIS